MNHFIYDALAFALGASFEGWWKKKILKSDYFLVFRARFPKFWYQNDEIRIKIIIFHDKNENCPFIIFVPGLRMMAVTTCSLRKAFHSMFLRIRRSTARSKKKPRFCIIFQQILFQNPKFRPKPWNVSSAKIFILLNRFMKVRCAIPRRRTWPP